MLEITFRNLDREDLWDFLQKKIVEPYLTISLDTAVLDMSEDEPGGAVAHREHPAGDDDPLRPGQGADVLKIVN